MPLYVLKRDYLHRSTLGVISFKAGEPTGVPSFMEREIVQIGGERVDGDAPEALEPEQKLPEVPAGEEREQQIGLAFDLLVERNDSGDFTGQGVPTVKAVEKIVGFDVDRKELAELWQARKEAQ